MAAPTSPRDPALHTAASWEMMGEVKRLLAEGADIEEKGGRFECTALHAASAPPGPKRGRVGQGQHWAVSLSLFLRLSLSFSPSFSLPLPTPLSPSLPPRLSFSVHPGGADGGAVMRASA